MTHSAVIHQQALLPVPAGTPGWVLPVIAVVLFAAAFIAAKKGR